MSPRAPSNYLVNTILWFLKTRLKNTDQESLIKTVLNYYTTDDIRKARDQLWAWPSFDRALSKSTPRNNRKILETMMLALRNMDINPQDSDPHFVTDSDSFPLVDLRYVDRAGLCNDVQSLKNLFKSLPGWSRL